MSKGSILTESAPTIHRVQFSQMGKNKTEAPPVSPSNIVDFPRDVPLRVQVELGRTKMVVKDISRLVVGSVIELEKQTGESIDIIVNNRLIARGEVVEIGGYFGARVTEIPSKSNYEESLLAKDNDTTSVSVMVELGITNLMFKELSALEEGDFIKLDQEITNPLRVKVNERAKFLGRPGLQGSKVSVEITRVLQEGDEEFDE